ncbi:MAG: hypothetical protein LBC46_01395 [Treponema sp.]|nr:hypothetical protein [Treponema sp.]
MFNSLEATPLASGTHASDTLCRCLAPASLAPTSLTPASASDTMPLAPHALVPDTRV